MPSNNIPGYVARYGDALRRMHSQPLALSPLQEVNGLRMMDPNLTPPLSGLAQESAAGIEAAATGPAPLYEPPEPRVMGPADSIGALQTPPPAPKPAARKGRSFRQVADSLKPEEKQQVAEQFEKQGVDLKKETDRLIQQGADPAMLKRRQDGSYDKADMGMFLLEQGLLTMQAAATGGSSMGAVATGALGAMEARRARAAAAASGAESTRRWTVEQQQKADEEAGRNKRTAAEQEGQNTRAKANNETDLAIAKINAVSRERAAKMANGKDADTFIDETDGNVYWKTGEPVLVKKNGKEVQLKGKTQRDPREVGERDVMDAVEKHRAALDENLVSQVTIPGESAPVRWRNATPEQKTAYLRAYSQELQQQAGKQTPSTTGGKNVFDQFDEG
jgi:hypothetical protein